jgi:type I restriction enzyme M protein
MGQYFTPLEVIRFVVEVASPTVGELVLDPFAGSGHFLTQCLDAVRDTCRGPGDTRIDEFAAHKLHGIEKSDRMVRVAMTDMRLHGDGHGHMRCTDALLAFENYQDLRPESFDLVLTNPPFGCLLGPEAIGRLGKFQLAQGHKSVPLEVLGLERCVQFLRPGGRLGIVLPDGILANRGMDYVRDWLEQHVRVRAIVSLPIETFTPFGANIRRTSRRASCSRGSGAPARSGRTTRSTSASSTTSATTRPGGRDPAGSCRRPRPN